MSEAFNQSVWRTYYDDIMKIGTLLKECLDQECFIPWDEREKLRKEADNLCKQCANYMNSHGLRLARPLWFYNSKDKSTWYSHESFEYYHLMRK